MYHATECEKGELACGSMKGHILTHHIPLAYLSNVLMVYVVYALTSKADQL